SHVEIPCRWMMRDNRARALLGLKLKFLAERNADPLRLEQLHQRRLVLQPRARRIAEGKPAALVTLLEEHLELAGVALCNTQLHADLLVHVLSQRLGRLHAQAVQEQILLILIRRE